MRTSFVALAWTFVVAVSAYDIAFAWHYRAVFDAWELNPVARWMAHLYGLGVVCWVKAILIAFALWVAMYCHRLRHRLEIPYTFTVWTVHLALTAQYVRGMIA
jgi:hypothetical protein